MSGSGWIRCASLLSASLCDLDDYNDLGIVVKLYIQKEYLTNTKTSQSKKSYKS